MASVPNERTSLEQCLASFMWAAGLRGWRRTTKVQRTRPDFVFRRYRLAVFVDGCFWHGCPHCCRRPATNTAYWHTKLDRNMERDREQTQRLRDAGWTVVRLWGHEVERDPEGCALRVKLALDHQDRRLHIGGAVEGSRTSVHERLNFSCRVR